MKTDEQIAQLFHETYEKLAPDFCYETRKESAKPWSEIPDKNKRLMISVCGQVRKQIEIDARNDALDEAVKCAKKHSSTPGCELADTILSLKKP